MRHRVYGKHLGRDKDERRNLFKGLVRSLMISGTIETSETKAKAIKGLVDKIINSLKKDLQIAGQPLVQSFLNNKDLKRRMVKDILPKLGNKTSGYTRAIRLGTRLGDQTTMVRMSLIGAEELKPIAKESRIKNLESSEESKEPKITQVKKVSSRSKK